MSHSFVMFNVYFYCDDSSRIFPHEFQSNMQLISNFINDELFGDIFIFDVKKKKIFQCF